MSNSVNCNICSTKLDSSNRLEGSSLCKKCYSHVLIGMRTCTREVVLEEITQLRTLMGDLVSTTRNYCEGVTESLTNLTPLSLRAALLVATTVDQLGESADEEIEVLEEFYKHLIRDDFRVTDLSSELLIRLWKSHLGSQLEILKPERIADSILLEREGLL